MVSFRLTKVRCQCEGYLSQNAHDVHNSHSQLIISNRILTFWYWSYDEKAGRNMYAICALHLPPVLLLAKLNKQL